MKDSSKRGPVVKIAPLLYIETWKHVSFFDKQYVNYKKVNLSEFIKFGGYMGITKKFFYDYEDYEDGEKNADTLLEEILQDEELPQIKELIIGCWGESWDTSAQTIIDGLISNSEKFKNIEHLFMGDMTFEECEVSWIIQGDYSNLWAALPNLKALTIKGSSELELGEITHNNLESLEIICGGLPQTVISSIASSKLPNLKKLNLYLGVDSYGFDADIDDIKQLLKNESFESLEYLGLGDSEIQDEVIEAVMESEIVKQLKTLDFSNGTTSNKGAQIILDNKEKLTNLEYLNLEYHFIGEEYMAELEKLPFEVNLKEQQENDEEYGNYPMLTE